MPFDPYTEVPRTLTDLFDWVAAWERFNNPKSTDRRIPIYLSSGPPAYDALVAFGQIQFNSPLLTTDVLLKIRARYVLATGITHAQAGAASIEDVAQAVAYTPSDQPILANQLQPAGKVRKPFRDVLDAANKIKNATHHVVNGMRQFRQRHELDLNDAMVALQNEVERQLGVPMPACKPSYRDGQNGFRIDVKHALENILATARLAADAAKATLPFKVALENTNSSDDRAALREAADHVRELERRLSDRIADLTKLQREVEPRPPIAQLPIAAPAPLTEVEPELDFTGLNGSQIATLKVIAALPNGVGISGKEIVAALLENRIKISERYLRRHIIPKLKETHGIENHPAAGGYLIRQSSAKRSAM